MKGNNAPFAGSQPFLDKLPGKVDVDSAVGFFIDPDGTCPDGPEDGVDARDELANWRVIQVVHMHGQPDLARRHPGLYSRRRAPGNHMNRFDIRVGERRFQ